MYKRQVPNWEFFKVKRRAFWMELPDRSRASLRKAVRFPQKSRKSGAEKTKRATGLTNGGRTIMQNKSANRRN